MKACLYVACYGGPRRTEPPEYAKDKTYYLKLQQDALTRYPHDCDVVFCSNGGPPEYENYLDEEIRPLFRVVKRENEGMSYGAWNAGVKLYPKHDFYIFLEDDYLFVQPYFDLILIDEWMRRSPESLGYLCLAIDDFPSQGTPWPIVMNGIMSSVSYRAIGGLAESGGYEFDMDDSSGQRGVAHRLRNENLRIEDMRKRFRIPFQDFGMRLTWYDQELYKTSPEELLIVPSMIYSKVTA